jgi:DNA topoisomerase-2
VNGICTTKGGTHVDSVANLISHGIVDDLAKKIKLRPQQVKNTLFVLVRATLVNPTFSSQIKSECTLKSQEFGSRFEPPKNFIKNVLKTGIQDEVLALSRAREEKDLKKTDGAKRSKITGIPKLDDANWAGTARSDRTTLIITEGDSAKTLAIAGLSVVGRDAYGVFPLRGKCKNVRDASAKQLMENEEFNNLKKILGLQQGKVYSSVKELRYGKLMIMTDADNDGSHIKGLVLNMFHYFWPSLLEIGFVICMVTPIVKVTKGKQQRWFFTDSAFRADESSKPGSGWKVKYYKGLGTSTSVEAKEYFKSIEKLTVGFEVDEETDKSVVLAFDKTQADARKLWLTKNSSGHDEIKYGSINSLTVTRFIHNDLVDFSLADVKRSIAHMCDGFKPSQRKVLFACFKKNLRDDMKVAQLAAYVSETTAYHHGEVSLADTIVKMAHDYVGSNNMNLLYPSGQFGTRLLGGKDSSQTRYIFTRLMPYARQVFDPADDAVLTYLTDDGKPIEPEYFVPVLPLVLVNGTEGIGTGFSSSVPPFNPDDIKDNIRSALKGESIKKMTPWFSGFKGTVVASGDAWVATGVYSNRKVTELPPGLWTQDFREHLDGLVDKKVISGYKNNSTTESVDFEIEGYSGKDPIKDFKLAKTIRVSNMHLFHPKQGIKKYQSAEEILVDFVEIRLDYYKKRKAHLKRRLEQEVVTLTNKAGFVQKVVNDEIIIFKRKKSNLEEQIASHGFIKVDGSYDYLLNIKTYQYTEEAIEALLGDSVAKQKELKNLEATSIIRMWENNLLE